MCEMGELKDYLFYSSKDNQQDQLLGLWFTST